MSTKFATTMMRRRIGMLAVIAVALAFAGIASASAGGHATDAATGAAHASVPSDDHWSVVTALVGHAALDNLRGMWGKTWVTGAPMGSYVLHVVMAGVVFVLAVLLTFAATARIRGAKNPDEAAVPSGRFNLLTFFELAAEALLGTMKNMMGEKHARHFFPLILSFAVFILLSNLLGMVPGFVTPTANLNTTFALGLIVFLTTHAYGVKENGLAYFAHFFGPMRGLVWAPLMILMFGIELISHIARPVSLGMRLMGNMYGDHMVLASFLSFGILLVPLPVMALGLMVCFVQTLVFCLLSIVYISQAIEHAEGHGEHH